MKKLGIAILASYALLCTPVITQAQFGVPVDSEAAQKYIEHLPETIAQIHYEIGRKAMEKGEYGLAINHFLDAVSYAPQKAEYRQALAEAQLKKIEKDHKK